MKKKVTAHPYATKLVVQICALAALLLAGGDAFANTLTQNLSWTVDRANTTAKFRVVAYGDSIFAGYNGSISSVDQRAAPEIQGEYLSKAWNADIEVVRRTKSGALASDIYNNKIVGEKSFMQATNTRVVTFEMCGNDFLQARSSFAGQSGTCDLTPINNALANCTKYQELGMQTINANAPAAATKIIMNLYYPGYGADNANTSCTVNGAPLNKQTAFLPLLARSNWRACNFANQYGFKCVDAFSQFMGSDYDSNSDGLIDSEALKVLPGESEDAYVQRISVTLRSTLVDANTHFTSPSTSFDYILSDNTHPTFSGNTVFVGLIGGSGSGSGAPTFTDAQIVNGQNPIFNRFGHDRAGWAHSLFDALSP